SLHLTGDRVSGCIGMRLFLPESWASDAARCRSAAVPGDVSFMPKWGIALKQPNDALSWGIRRHVGLADAGFGDVSAFREGLNARSLDYIVGISGQPVVWRPESTPEVPPATGGRGRPTTRYRDADHPPLAIAELAPTLRYRKVSWRHGSR